jgi:hypothetical protein
LKIPNGYGTLATLAGNFRNQVKAKFSHTEDRRYFWEKAFSGLVAEDVFAGKVDEAQADLQAQLDGSADSDIGEVYLVGGGPGELSNLARINRANTGALPADEIAMTIGLVSTIDGITKLHKSGESTTLTGILAFFANSDTCILSAVSFVAETIST